MVICGLRVGLVLVRSCLRLGVWGCFQGFGLALGLRLLFCVRCVLDQRRFDTIGCILLVRGGLVRLLLLGTCGDLISSLMVRRLLRLLRQMLFSAVRCGGGLGRRLGLLVTVLLRMLDPPTSCCGLLLKLLLIGSLLLLTGCHTMMI